MDVDVGVLKGVVGVAVGGGYVSVEYVVELCTAGGEWVKDEAEMATDG